MFKNKVLFVDDENNVLNSIRRGVMDEEYESIFVASGQDALEIINNNEISVIVTDMKMPNMDGLELLKLVKEKSPNTVRMVLSGYTQLSQILVTINQGEIFKFITKPWKLEEEFLPSIREAVAYYNLKRENEEYKLQIQMKNDLYVKILDANNELIQNINNDIKEIKSISNVIFSIQKFFIEKLHKEEMSYELISYYINWCEDTFQEFLQTVPFKIEKFTLEDFEQELKEALKEDLNLYIDNEKDKQEGEYKRIVFITKKLLENILKYSTLDKFKVVVKTYPTMSINIVFNKDYKDEFIENKNELRLLLKILSQMSLSIGGEILLDDKNNIVKFICNTKSTKEEPVKN